ncbi:phage major capsid protein [Fusibacter sp. JL298sf-3]
MKRRKFELQLFAGPLENPDIAQAEMKEKIKNAIESGDAEEFARVQLQIAKEIESKLLEEHSVLKQESDEKVFAARGMNVLTAEEHDYYNEVITEGGFGGAEKLMPATVFERVFEYLRTNHPLLAKIKFQNTTGTTEFISRNNEVSAAWWGKLTDEIKKKLEMAFVKEKSELYKLSAFVPVSKSMLDLGPAWLDQFVREVLIESISVALELAIVSGTGVVQPIGMDKDLSKAVDPVAGHTLKENVVLPDFKPKTLGKVIMSPLTKEGKRAVTEVLLIVNPLDYWEKIFPQTTVLTANGVYVHGVLPIPATVVQSVAVSRNKMIAGVGSDYFMGIGSTRKLEYSDQYRFLEDERTYLTKMYCNGRPKDNESFIVLDISALADAEVPTV